ncbi:hypothetical protein WA026_012244 [Henosepilachna vigintioctopunctata]|uniref:Translocator protein n=1 Tax=Henosepilachna vigintioctopunctata TaxID=420089 RepID=A0AAW1VDK7_9CUCU
MSLPVNIQMIGAIVLPNLGGIAGGIITKKNLNPWYENLKKPKCRPPNWAFGPVWTTLYSGIGYASYIAFKDGGGFTGAAKLPLLLYGTNLLANWAWTPIFFGAKDLDLALCEINLITVTAIGTGYLFYKINPLAGYLFIPYVAWLGVATWLNYRIAKDNPKKPNILKIDEKSN